MECPRCGTDAVAFDVPADLQPYAPAGGAAAICPRCLTVAPAPGTDDPGPALDDRLGDAFPRGEAAVALALLLGNLESLAGNRAAIEALLSAVESRGGDPLLAIDRLLEDSDRNPAIDLAGRRRQLEQLFY